MIIRDCLYHNNLNSLILILNCIHLPTDYFQQFHRSSVALLNSRGVDYYNKTKKENYNLDLNREKFRLFPTQTFIFVESEFLFLKDILSRLNNTILWNVDGTYINEYILRFNGCKHAYSFLAVMWDFNVVSAIFICRESNNEICIYTFNPYNDQAPKEWKHVKSYQKKNGHPFRLFNRPYESQGKTIQPINIDVRFYIYI